MSKKELIRKELADLYEEGIKLAVEFQDRKEQNFQYGYQRWYTKALSTVSVLAPDRLPEFRSYYDIDPKRKALG